MKNAIKEQRKSIVDANKITDLMKNVSKKMKEEKQSDTKVDLVSVAQKVGKEMSKRYEENSKNE